MVTKNQPKKVWVDNGTDFAREFKNLCKAEGIQTKSSMSETRAAFAESTKRYLINIPYRYTEDKGYKYIYSLSLYVTALNSWKNCSVDLIPKKITNSDLVNILHCKPIGENRKPKF